MFLTDWFYSALASLGESVNLNQSSRIQMTFALYLFSSLQNEGFPSWMRFQSIRFDSNRMVPGVKAQCDYE